MKRVFLYILTVSLVPLMMTACDSGGNSDGSGGGGDGGGDGNGVIQLTDAFPGLTFESPVDLENAGDGSGRKQRGA